MKSAASMPKMKRPLIAILRGITPADASETVRILVDEGLEAIEIPLNSPDAFRSIEMAVQVAGDRCLIGAGTVLSVADADRLGELGGRLLVSPNVDVEVISRGAAHGMVVMPGVFTATEALLALKSGASGLKFFPASALGPGGINAIRAILPSNTLIAAVGGVSDANFGDYVSKGIFAFGLGTSLYQPGANAAQTRERAARTIAAYDKAISQI